MTGYEMRPTAPAVRDAEVEAWLRTTSHDLIDTAPTEGFLRAMDLVSRSSQSPAWAVALRRDAFPAVVAWGPLRLAGVATLLALIFLLLMALGGGGWGYRRWGYASWSPAGLLVVVLILLLLTGGLHY